MPRILALTYLLTLLGGCASIVGERLADGVSNAILNQDDPATVRDGAPAFLLLIDGLIDQDPQAPDTLLAGARLYGAYSTAFVSDPDRAQRMAERSRGYARTALCEELEELCDVLDRPYREFQTALLDTKAEDVPLLYAYATAWAGWIQTRSTDWSAIADLPKLQALLERIVSLEEAYDGGGAHVYLGVLESLRPPAVGGRPEVARAHFERAIELSQGYNLMTKVLYARHYARLVFDRELHDRLLRDVLAADPHAPGLTLVNTLAQEQARELLAGADQYF